MQRASGKDLTTALFSSVPDPSSVEGEQAKADAAKDKDKLVIAALKAFNIDPDNSLIELFGEGDTRWDMAFGMLDEELDQADPMTVEAVANDGTPRDFMAKVKAAARKRKREDTPADEEAQAKKRERAEARAHKASASDSTKRPPKTQSSQERWRRGGPSRR